MDILHVEVDISRLVGCVKACSDVSSCLSIVYGVLIGGNGLAFKCLDIRLRRD